MLRRGPWGLRSLIGPDVAEVVLLLVEDEPLIALSIQDVLQAGGYKVQHAFTGIEGWMALESAGPIFSGLVTDIRCGAGPDGWEIARRAREITPKLPVVYVSGDSAFEHPTRGVPGSVMVQKPFAAAQLLLAVSMLLNAALPAERHVSTSLSA
jgi:DNA-binding response OmpR family regulator